METKGASEIGETMKAAWGLGGAMAAALSLVAAPASAQISDDVAAFSTVANFFSALGKAVGPLGDASNRIRLNSHLRQMSGRLSTIVDYKTQLDSQLARGWCASNRPGLIATATDLQKEMTFLIEESKRLAKAVQPAELSKQANETTDALTRLKATKSLIYHPEVLCSMSVVEARADIAASREAARMAVADITTLSGSLSLFD